MINPGWGWRPTDARVVPAYRFGAIVMCALIAVGAGACGHGIFSETSASSSSGGGGSTTARAVYVTNFADGKVAALANISGTLSSPATIAAGAASGPLGLTLTPPGSTAPIALYVANPADNTIHEFGVSSTGNLSALATITAGTQPQQIAVDPSGSFAYAINAGGSISEYLINSATGQLSANAPSSITTGLTTPVSAVASGSYLYVTDPRGGAGVALTFSIANGLLSFSSSVTTGGTDPGPIAALSASGGSTWVFVADATSGVVSVFQVQGAALALFGTISTGAGAAGLAFTNPSGGNAFLFVANPVLNSVASFSFNTITGVLAPLAVTTGFDAPTGLAVDNPANPTTLFVTNNGNGTVTTLAINAATGQLTAIGSFATENPANAGSAPEYVAVIP
jgi:6-phosphogluconolactonase (cycloisomerase 2 family)